LVGSYDGHSHASALSSTRITYLTSLWLSFASIVAAGGLIHVLFHYKLGVTKAKTVWHIKAEIKDIP